jgi:predicted MFS family arabinose efflux permease
LSSPINPAQSPTRAIVFLAFAAFASQAMVRVTDPLLPQIASDIGTTVGTASIVTSAYAVSHGLTQLFGTPLGDRLPKYMMVAALCLACAVATAACGLSQSLTSLGIARLACGVTAGTLIPLCMAFIGDTVPYERRQAVLGRFLAGTIMGLVSGQVIGGVVGDYFGWRSVFFFIAALFVFVALTLASEILRNPVTRAWPRPSQSRGVLADYSAVIGNPWARTLCIAGFLEWAIMFGAFAYIGADLHTRLDLSFSGIGLVLAAFGIGGLTYVVMVRWLVDRLGQIGLVRLGGVLLSLAFLALALLPSWWMAFAMITLIGLSFQMIHNTLQVNATQMAPEARSMALGVFSFALYAGQAFGVAAAAPVVDRHGAVPVFLLAAAAWPLLAWWVITRLRKRPAT